MSLLSDNSIHGWIAENEIKNEKGEPIDFKNHLFLFDIYRDPADNLVVEKPAQVGLSTLEILKNHFDAKKNRMDIIYTLPTDQDVHVFVGGKVNRIIANNPCMLADVADKDSIEQKAIGQSMMYYRGTWSKKAAIMVTADRLVHDEKDSSKQDVVKDYQARLQHSKFKQTHVFSHPSTPNNGVDIEWQLSDMKEWFIRCPHCNHRQFMSWNTEDPKKMSIDMELGAFVCKKCRGILSDADRAVGEWVARKPGAAWSGYHISLLMASWVSAKEIVDKYNDTKQTIDFFYNKVLGLPYAGSGNSVQEDTILGAVSDQKTAHTGRLVVGVDSGIDLRYVIGNKAGLLGYGQMKQWEPDAKLGIPLEQTIEYFLVKFPDSIMVIDQGGDIIGPRKLRAKYPGRVFLCHYRKDRKTMELIQWGKNEEAGNVVVDRNRMIQLVIDEVREKRWRLFQGDRNAWYNYWLHWSHIYRVWEEDEMGIRRFQWLRNDRDDWVHATVYWRIGVDRFGGNGAMISTSDPVKPNSYMLNPDGTVSFNPDEMFTLPDLEHEEDEWR